ncbi:furin-like protease 1 [Anastrepha obliqua]|uniref:furin-like protease 1 n=1 Tax=Anastrepha obliqua TaxID=95512 RepID=UPI00240A12C1|nr:furin-like protease 1 [Anastrepha obliqua]
MKNDVVRWSLTAKAQIGNDDAISTSKSKSNCTSRNVAVNSNTSSSNAATNSEWLLGQHHKQLQLQLQHQLQKQQQHCDTNASFLNATTPTTNSFLVNTRHSVSHNAIKRKSKSTTSTHSRHFQQQQQLIQPQKQQQQHNHYSHHRHQQQVKPRTFVALHLNRILLNCVQLSVVLVFLLCTLNIGFVIVPSASAAIAAAHTNKTSVDRIAVNAIDGSGIDDLALVSVPYQLDYEESESGSGIYGDRDGAGHYTHTWAVHIPNGESGVADQVARDHGFVNLGKYLVGPSLASITASSHRGIEVTNENLLTLQNFY